MNNTRRKNINKISEQISGLRNQIEELLGDIEEVENSLDAAAE